MVHLGPFTEPVRSRQDIVSRLRVHALAHTFEPHEGAIPLALSGVRRGQPEQAGVGAAVQRYFQAHADAPTGQPHAWMLFSLGGFPTDDIRAATAVGTHPAGARPQAVEVQNDPAFIDALARTALRDRRARVDTRDVPRLLLGLSAPPPGGPGAPAGRAWARLGRPARIARGHLGRWRASRAARRGGRARGPADHAARPGGRRRGGPDWGRAGRGVSGRSSGGRTGLAGSPAHLLRRASGVTVVPAGRGLPAESGDGARHHAARREGGRLVPAARP